MNGTTADGASGWHRERAWLGFAGLVPFAATWLAIVGSNDPGVHGLAVDLMRTYAAVIASFLGAVHWGLAAMDPRRRAARLRWGVMPALLAWALLLLPPAPSLLGFAALFAIVLYVDLRLLPLPGRPFRRLRTQLTSGVILLLLLAAIGQPIGG
jgi:hypothetical protein